MNLFMHRLKRAGLSEAVAKPSQTISKIKKMRLSETEKTKNKKIKIDLSGSLCEHSWFAVIDTKSKC